MIKADIQGTRVPVRFKQDLDEFMVDAGMNFIFKGMNPRERGQYVTKVFNDLVIFNPYCPNNSDLDLMMKDFYHAVKYGFADFKDKSVVGLIQAFNNWITQPMVKAKHVVVREVKRLDNNEGRTLADYDDDELINLMATIAKIKWDGPYVDKVFDEAFKRGLKPKQ